MTASLLLIDADPPTSSSLCPVLRQAGYHVALADPGLGAIRGMLAEAPDLVILGVNCQRGDWKFCHRLISNISR